MFLKRCQNVVGIRWRWGIKADSGWCWETRCYDVRSDWWLGQCDDQIIVLRVNGVPEISVKNKHHVNGKHVFNPVCYYSGSVLLPDPEKDSPESWRRALLLRQQRHSSHIRYHGPALSGTHTPVHTHTHTPTHTCIHAHTHRCVYACVCVCVRAHVHECLGVRVHSHIYTHACVCTHTSIHTRTYTHTHAHTPILPHR